MIDLKLALAALLSPPTVWSSNRMSLFYSHWIEEMSGIRVKLLNCQSWFSVMWMCIKLQAIADLTKFF
uniref:hypothetical protein n=1 Tax=Trichocoleus desertorum TaxID=1481672 RepID=UPI0025B521FE|nr:hypothetical protein [Trichocoleus desertorum]